MRHRSLVLKALSLLCVALAINMCTYDIGIAQLEENKEQADSTRAAVNMEEQIDKLFPFSATSDSLMQINKSGPEPVYRTWWFWVTTIAVMAITAIIVVAQSEDEPEPMLPDFPEPPER
jgi:hypothetical protein